MIVGYLFYPKSCWDTEATKGENAKRNRCCKERDERKNGSNILSLDVWYSYFLQYS